jgi:RHS repeat-associated protein
LQARSITAEKIYEAGYPTKWHKIFPGDFNGDRKTDLLTRGTTNNSWETAISKGKDNTFATTAFTFNHTVDVNSDVLDIADFDGDSKTDILHWYTNTPSTSKLEMYYSRGNTFNPVAIYDYGIPSPLVGNTYRNYIQGDYNGDGKADLIARYYYQDPVKMLFFYKDSKNMMLEKAANGFNHLTTFQYKSLSEGGTFYTKGTASSYPLMDLQMPLYAVSSVSESNGNGTNNTTTYAYEKAKLHRKGRGLLGFEKTVASNSSMNHKVTTEYEVNTTFYINMLKQVTQAVLTTNANKSLSVYTNGVVSLSNGRYWQRVNNVNSGIMSSVPTRYVSLTYDANGNVTQEIYTQTDFNNTGTVETGTTTHTYGTYCAWLPSKPTQTTISVTRTGQPTFTKTIARTFSATNGSLTQEVDFSGLAKAVTTSYQYNSFGNVTSVSTSATGLTTRTVTSVYDAKGRFATSITNPLNQVATAVYSAKWGKPTSQTGVNGLTITHTYDAFGRMTGTVTPEGNSVTTSYVWDVQGSNSIGGTTIVFYTNNIIPGRPDGKEWFDVLGRSRRTETEGMGTNQWVITQKTYDNRGNLATATAPYFNGGSGVVTTYGYDDFNRQTSAVNSAGTTTNAYSFVSGQYKVTVTRPDATTSSQTSDTAGKMVSATDNGGTLNYDYNSAGKQTAVKIGTTVIAAMGYDAYGRQTSLDDKDGGVTTYVYNAFGELASQTDANGNTHTMSYDVMGRITSRVGPEGTTTYEYVTATNNGKNLLKKVTGFNGILQEYTYDAYSRMTQEKETVDGTAYTTNYSYNNFGDVTSMTFPSGFSVNNFYDSKGFHTDITNSNYSIIFDVVSLNAYGQYTSYALGNGITTTKSYDAYGFPTNFTAGTKQNLSMSFNIQNGNLNSRTDNLKGKTETFAYDNLDRLTSSTVTGQGAIAVTYAGSGTTTGNITNKTSIGAYTYSNVKIHAVTNISNPNGTVPTTTQDIAYTAYHQPATIMEGIHKVTFTYGPDYERRKMVVEQNNAVTETRYYFNNYEKIVSGGTTTHLHYITCGAGLVAIVKRVGTTDTYHYAYTDHLGSLVRMTNPSGSDWEQNFDAWGRQRNPNDWTYSNLPTLPSWIYRGYTGHEHLPQFNLINMNGRLYDPLIARMLSVDNNVQAPASTQNYNRYSYVMNNPLKYKDPDGEFFLGALINGIAGAIRGDGFFPSVGQYFENKWDIARGLVQTDGSKNFWGRALELGSRFTWQLPQTVLGHTLAQSMNSISLVNEVNHFRGATVLDSRFEGGAFTVGSFIMGPRGMRPDFRDHLFVHEYGHYLQSQRVGLFYMSTVAFPSLTDSWIFPNRHDFRWYEAQASRLSADYFDEQFGSGQPGFVAGDPNFFDINSFVSGIGSPYQNPRNFGFNRATNPIQSQFHWSDIPINLVFNGGIGMLGFWFF